MHKSIEKGADLFFNTHIAAAWVLFSIVYWFAAYYKPVHVDEFYSWVYAERCSFADILSLADHGIGHPPMYHVLQKIAAVLLPYSFPISLRIVNYIAGSIFIIMFVRLLLLQRHLPAFCYGAACSAIILNTFVFSRMYGLVLLFSLLFYWCGEKYYERANLKNAVLLLSVFSLGMYADYNFIVLAPYLAIIPFHNSRWCRRSQFCVVGLLFVLWLTLTYYSPKNVNLQNVFAYDLMSHLVQTGFSLSRIWAGFLQWELFIAAVLLLIALTTYTLRSKKQHLDENDAPVLVYWFMASTIFLGVSCFLVDNEILRLRFIPILIVAWIGLTIWKRKYIFREEDSRNIWYMYAITCGFLKVLCANAIFSADLTKIRFVQILIPFMLILLYRNATKKILHLVAGIFFVTGILYIQSNMIGWWYAPSAVKADHRILYENEYGYSTQYFYERNEGVPKPVFLGETGFAKWCRVCEMGSIGAISNTDERIGIISQYGHDIKTAIPESMKLIRSELLISQTDECFLAIMHPIENRRYLLSVFARIHPLQ